MLHIGSCVVTNETKTYQSNISPSGGLIVLHSVQFSDVISLISYSDMHTIVEGSFVCGLQKQQIGLRRIFDISVFRIAVFEFH